MYKKVVSSLVLPVLMFGSFSSLAVADTTTNPPFMVTTNLTVGDSGSEVVELQTYLVANDILILPEGTQMGHFGALTKAAVKAYQESVGLPSTGFVGPLTRAKLSAGQQVSTMPTTPTMTMMLPSADTKAAGLRVLLNALERQHVDLASAAVRSGFDGRPDFTAAAGVLDDNSVAISKAVGSVYGDAAAAKFLAIWRSHITFFVNYTVAAKKGDKAGMDKAVADLGGYVDAISDFFSGANPNLPREAVHQLVNQHVMLLKAAVDTYGAADYAGSYKNQVDANAQIGTIADAIAGAIVKQYPEKF